VVSNLSMRPMRMLALLALLSHHRCAPAYLLAYQESFAKAAENAVAEAAKTVMQDRSRSSSISGQQKMLQHAKSARARITTTHFVGHATEL
jgi:hypothetical protein